MGADKFFYAKPLVPYTPPITQESYGLLSLTLTPMGLFFVLWFFAVQAGSTKTGLRQFVKEILMSISASLFLGAGSIFGLLALGIYV
ncbi:transmembrane protein 258-like [Varroa jacobsoni]|uniref:Dolichyl-diphosphooligosaccharide-protein glycosyltransferase subunit TMEM258 n=1 Tax=Varroa destructor TaxID=109461 RepID=A0A7M7JHB3_VARDE|nr:transmembrane protein 258-like [Varroa destructor]XP_022711193.1 transmembrane protein 258-like [Varroa jacobsoni]